MSLVYVCVVYTCIIFNELLFKPKQEFLHGVYTEFNDSDHFAHLYSLTRDYVVH